MESPHRPIYGVVAQLVERALRMREVPGSKPGDSIFDIIYSSLNTHQISLRRLLIFNQRACIEFSTSRARVRVEYVSDVVVRSTQRAPGAFEHATGSVGRRAAHPAVMRPRRTPSGTPRRDASGGDAMRTRVIDVGDEADAAPRRRSVVQ
ncbi:hypothetical protein BE221DRAFT_80945 [Ostreococcus tauri]|uniref:Uncharacterized protein n=1 Tax=Ostreococcus tauri TaxID=70448 RepID=A0A1Y5I7U7_OSTTA|nr:hypothetical protein BE221DRAFT_80945 [Ostreococcus tauri]